MSNENIFAFAANLGFKLIFNVGWLYQSDIMWIKYFFVV